MYSYGSGVASSMFVLRAQSDTKYIAEKLKIAQRLKDRVEVNPEDYDRLMENRSKNFGKANYVPVTPIHFDFMILARP